MADIIQKAKRKRQAEKQGSTKLGMMRHLFIIIDCSDSMANQDLKPTRLLCTLKVFEDKLYFINVKYTPIVFTVIRRIY